MALDALYREVVLDHHRHPRGNHPVARVDARAEGLNPSCGDEVEVELQVSDDRIHDVGVRSRGCAISVASGSMLAEVLAGKSLAEARCITAALQRMLRGESEGLELSSAACLDAAATAEIHDDAPSSYEEDAFEDLEALAGVRQLPARIKCAALPWMTLLEALERAVADGRAGSAEEGLPSARPLGDAATDRARGAHAGKEDAHGGDR